MTDSYGRAGLQRARDDATSAVANSLYSCVPDPSLLIIIVSTTWPNIRLRTQWVPVHSAWFWRAPENPHKTDYEFVDLICTNFAQGERGDGQICAMFAQNTDKSHRFRLSPTPQAMEIPPGSPHSRAQRWLVINNETKTAPHCH